MEKYTIGILTVGSGVGQSVIESLRLSNYNFYTIGLGNNLLAFGAYECNRMVIIPSFYHDDYISQLLRVCLNESIDILIPGTDDEAHILSKNLNTFNSNNIKVITSTSNFMELIRNKANLYHAFKNVSDIFLPCYSIYEVKQLLKNGKIIFPLISKPKDGNASRGITILLNDIDLLKVTENDIIQELAIPHSDDPNHQIYNDLIFKHINPQIAELSFQLLLNQKGEEISRMLSYNKLNNGVPIEIIPIFNDSLWEKINPIIPYLKKLGARGPINIQGRMTDNGLKCFEINARFTGITGLRAEMGFNEVEKLVLDYLNIQNNIPIKINPNRVGIRQTSNKSILLTNNDWLYNNPTRKFNSIIVPKTVFVTGANGILGQEIIKCLLKTNVHVIALVRNDLIRNNFRLLFSSIEIVTLDEVYQGNFNFGLIDTIIHALFARQNKDNNQIKTSLDITQFLLEQVSKYQIPEFIHVSSQSVYGQYTHAYPEIKLDSLYSQAKYTCEIMVNLCQRLHPHLKLVNIRLSTLTSNQTLTHSNELLSFWTNKALNHETIYINEHRYLHRLDVKDAAYGLTKLIDSMNLIKSSFYDFGSPLTYSTEQIAYLIQDIGNERYNLSVRIKKHEDIKIFNNSTISSELFYKIIEWQPKISIKDSIISLFELISQNINI